IAEIPRVVIGRGPRAVADLVRYRWGRNQSPAADRAENAESRTLRIVRFLKELKRRSRKGRPLLRRQIRRVIRVAASKIRAVIARDFPIPQVTQAVMAPLTCCVGDRDGLADTRIS